MRWQQPAHARKGYCVSTGFRCTIFATGSCLPSEEKVELVSHYSPMLLFSCFPFQFTLAIGFKAI